MTATASLSTNRLLISYRHLCTCFRILVATIVLPYACALSTSNTLKLLCRRFGVAVRASHRVIQHGRGYYGNCDFDLFISRLFHGLHVQTIGWLPISIFVADFIASPPSVD